MPRNRPPSPQTIRVLRALAADPTRWRHGYDLGTETDLKAGSLYPILLRLTDRGLLEAVWEEPAPHGRPARHLYRLTAEGRELAATTAATVIAATNAATNAAPPARTQQPARRPIRQQGGA